MTRSHAHNPEKIDVLREKISKLKAHVHDLEQEAKIALVVARIECLEDEKEHFECMLVSLTSQLSETRNLGALERLSERGQVYREQIARLDDLLTGLRAQLAAA